jgi:hypothetical protein
VKGDLRAGERASPLRDYVAGSSKAQVVYNLGREDERVLAPLPKPAAAQ